MNQRIFDLSYQTKHSQLHLSMMLTAHALHAVWFDLEYKKYIGYECVSYDSTSSFKSAIRNFGSANKYCKSKSILIANQLFTLIPSDLYHDKDKTKLLSFNQAVVDDNFKTSTADIEGIHSKCIFGIHHDILDVLKESFDNIKIQPIAKPFIENSLTLSESQMTAFVEIVDGRMDVAVFSNKSLQLYNAFEYKTAEDVMYYLLFTFEQLNFDREKHTLYIAGEINEQGEIFTLIYQYIRNIKWLSRPAQFGESDVLKPLPRHYHFSLFNQILCE